MDARELVPEFDLREAIIGILVALILTLAFAAAGTTDYYAEVAWRDGMENGGVAW